MAITWVPANESWKMIGDQTKETQTNPDGVVEIGIQYVKTNEEGETESISVWEPTMSKDATDAIILKAKMKPEIEENSIKETSEEEVYIEEVVKDNNFLELPKGVYIEGGVFKIYENVDKFIDELFLKEYYEALVGFVSEKNFAIR